METKTYNELKQRVERLERLFNGGKGSGNFGHSGRPGLVGGSGDGSGAERFLFDGEIPSQNPQPTKDGYVVLHHNTDNENADSIDQEGLVVGRNLGAYQVSPEEGMGIWTDSRAKQDESYGGCTISFQVPAEDAKKFAVNDTQHLIPHNIAREDIVCIDRILYSQGKNGKPIKISNLKDNVDFYVGKGLDEKKVIGIIARNSHGRISEQEIRMIINGDYKKTVKNGGPGSGNFGHAGRPGKVGGSSKDSFSRPMRTKGFMEGDTVEVTLDDGKKVQGEYRMSARVSSGVRLATIKGEDGQIYTVPFRSDRVKMIRNYDAPDTTPAQRRTKKQKEALSEVFGILETDEKMQKYMLNNCGEDTAMALRDELKKAQENGVDFSNIKLKRMTSGRNRAQVSTAIWGSYDGIRTNYRAEVSLMVSPGLVAGGKNYEASLKREYDAGEKNTDTIASVFRHEIGHIRANNLVARLTNNNYNTSDYNRVNRLVTDKALKSTGLNFYDAGEKISRYATDDRSEMLAESFANPNKSNLTKAVVEAYNNFTQDDWGHTMNKVRKMELIREFDLCTGIPIIEPELDIIEE